MKQLKRTGLFVGTIIYLHKRLRVEFGRVRAESQFAPVLTISKPTVSTLQGTNCKFFLKFQE